MMRRLLAFVMCFLLASSLGLGSVAHANEPVVCIESTSEVFSASALSAFHADGDNDQVPADSENAYPHHHGGCHGHHVGVPIASAPVQHSVIRNDNALTWEQKHGAGLVGDPAIRPPQA